MKKAVTLLMLASGVLAALGMAAADGEFVARQNSLDRQVLARTLSGLMATRALPFPLRVLGESSRAEFYSGPGGSAWVLVTNADSSEVRSISLVFERRMALSEVSPITGAIRLRGRNTSFSFTFRPGAARLFNIRPEIEEIHVKPRVMLNPSVQYGNVITDQAGVPIYNEGETMWDIAVRVKVFLDADGRVDARLSRTGRQAESSIRAECDLAKLLGCDAFVALHSDATGDGSPGGGTWTFYADEDGKRLADAVHTRLLTAIRQEYPDVQDRGVREHWNRLFVLHNSGCPACLTEILFHSNPKERELLKEPRFQDSVARAVADGILSFFGERN